VSPSDLRATFRLDELQHRTGSSGCDFLLGTRNGTTPRGSRASRSLAQLEVATRDLIQRATRGTAHGHGVADSRRAGRHCCVPGKACGQLCATARCKTTARHI